MKPQTNIATNVAFEPLNKKGTRAAVVPDYGMVASEVDKVVSTVRNMGWDIGCLYNQFKVGNPDEMAGQVRKGLDRTNSY